MMLAVEIAFYTCLVLVILTGYTVFFMLMVDLKRSKMIKRNVQGIALFIVCAVLIILPIAGTVLALN